MSGRGPSLLTRLAAVSILLGTAASAWAAETQTKAEPPPTPSSQCTYSCDYYDVTKDRFGKPVKGARHTCTVIANCSTGSGAIQTGDVGAADELCAVNCPQRTTYDGYHFTGMQVR